MPLAVVLVHQLRYGIAYGGRASHALGAQGHEYLISLTPWIVTLAALGLGAFLVRVAKARTSDAEVGASPYGMLQVWATAALGLLAIYVGQELLEGAIATGHPAGLLGVFGDGGWVAVPAAVAVGGMLAIVFRGAYAVLVLVTRRRRRPGDRPSALQLRPLSVDLAWPAPLAGCAAGRAPPLGG